MDNYYIPLSHSKPGSTYTLYMDILSYTSNTTIRKAELEQLKKYIIPYLRAHLLWRMECATAGISCQCDFIDITYLEKQGKTVHKLQKSKTKLEEKSIRASACWVRSQIFGYGLPEDF